jgi:hypothetical protein
MEEQPSRIGVRYFLWKLLTGARARGNGRTAGPRDSFAALLARRLLIGFQVFLSFLCMILFLKKVLCIILIWLIFLEFFI